MLINVSHASDEAISQAIEISSAPVVAIPRPARDQRHPRNMPDALLRKLAAKEASSVSARREHSRKAFEWRTSHTRGKPFWDTSAIMERGTKLNIYEIDRLVAPQFPMLPAEIPQDVRISMDEWVAVVDCAIQLVGEDHVSLGE